MFCFGTLLNRVSNLITNFYFAKCVCNAYRVIKQPLGIRPLACKNILHPMFVKRMGFRLCTIGYCAIFCNGTNTHSILVYVFYVYFASLAATVICGIIQGLPEDHYMRSGLVAAQKSLLGNRPIPETITPEIMDLTYVNQHTDVSYAPRIIQGDV